MKQLIFAFLLIATTNIYGKIEKNLGDFKELKVYDRIEVELIKSDSNKVIITGKNTEDVVLVKKNGTLKIRMTVPKVFNGNDTTVRLYYTNIDIIDANEGTFIGSNDVMKQFEIDVRAQEGGSVKLQVENVTFVEAKAITGGVIKISGQAKNQNIDLTTGGSYLGKDLETEKAKINIKAAGEAHVRATKEVDVKVRAGGTAYIYGNPETLTENTFFGGKIIRKE
ncbi:MAG: head GIN domain-containing protein [Xanthomarina gelatinilytica]|uniref:head GIN domain-containing protein n=1 Tax=Xanthomarina gelatinilytica TaxID=1137281 RepID=UPI003A84F6C7